MKWLILIFGVASNAAASILIKYAGNTIVISELAKTPWKIFENYYLLIGIILYFFAFVFYILALKEFPLHVAHPILTSGAIAVVAIAAFIIFREPITFQKLIGIAFILIGVLLISKV